MADYPARRIAELLPWNWQPLDATRAAALYAGLDVVGPLYATTTELGARFRQIATTEGVPAAVRWRSAQFKE